MGKYGNEYYPPERDRGGKENRNLGFWGIVGAVVVGVIIALVILSIC